MLAIAPALLIPTPAKATTYDWDYTFDFTTGNQYGWTIQSTWGTWSGTRFSTAYVSGSYRLYIYYNFPVAGTIQHVEVDYAGVTGSSSDTDTFRGFTGLNATGTKTFGMNASYTAGAHTLTWDGSAANSLSFLFASNNTTRYLEVTRIRLAGTGGAPLTPTPTSTPTLTPTPQFITPGAVGSIPNASCYQLGIMNASFIDPNDWLFFGGAGYADTSTNTGLLLAPGGQASLQTTLDPTKAYTWQLIYQADDTADTGSIIVKIADQPYQVDISQDTTSHTYTGQPVQFDNPSGYIELTRPLGDTGSMKISYFCISEAGTKSATVTNTTDPNADTCQQCSAPYGITDINGIINWLLCHIRNLFVCFLIPAINIVIKFIVSILQGILGFAQWVIDANTKISNWVTGIIEGIVGVAAGFLRNLFTGISNGFHTSGIADAANTASSTARDLPTTLSNEISGLAGQLSDVFKTSTNIVELILRLIWIGVSAIFRVISLIPLAIQALIDGINSANAPISGSPLCSDTSSLLYGPCLGFYVADNTIFQGPAKYLIPVLIGVICFDTLTWAFTRIKDEFRGS